jgi:RIO kinase 1
MAQRSFQARVQYQEGRQIRGSRQARAINRGSKFGRREQEVAWKNTEVDALYKLAEAGVSVPRPHGYFNGVLLMAMVTDEHGEAAPRLGEVELSPDAGVEYHTRTGARRGAHALPRPDPRRPVRVQRAGRAGRPGDHRSCRRWSAPPATTTRAPCCCAMCTTCAPAWAGSPPNCWPPTTARRCGRCSRSGQLQPDTALTGASCSTNTPQTCSAVMDSIEDARQVALIRQQGREAAAESD